MKHMYNLILLNHLAIQINRALMTHNMAPPRLEPLTFGTVGGHASNSAMPPPLRQILFCLYCTVLFMWAPVHVEQSEGAKRIVINETK